MVVSLRFFARNALAIRTSTIGSISRTAGTRLFPNTNRISPGRFLHASVPRDVALSEQYSVADITSGSEDPQDDPNWRHPRHGFAVADYPRLVYIPVPRKTTEEDLRFLLDKAGFPGAQITLFYELELGTCACFCYVKFKDESQANSAVSSLSRYTLFGFDIEPEKYDRERFPHWQTPSLFAGWLPSPSSDLKDRVVRPLITAPPKLLPPLMAEQWVRLQNLPPVDLARKEARFEVVHNLYQLFYKYNVVGITTIRLHSNGWSCKVQFGSPWEAKAARKEYVEAGKFMGRPAKAKIFRSGPNIHKILWDYRQSLPEDTTDNEVGVLLEKKYRELITRDRPSLHRNDHPTPESAVRLKNMASALE